MPRDAFDFIPSWEGKGGDMYVESGAPIGDVTEDQVRKFFQSKGLNDQEIDVIMTNATKAHGGGGANGPPEGPVPDRSAKESELDDIDNRDELHAGPKPLFRGDRAGKPSYDQQPMWDAMEEDFQNEGNPFSKRDSNPGNPGTGR
jgi:hypothetical protein